MINLKNKNIKKYKIYEIFLILNIFFILYIQIINNEKRDINNSFENNFKHYLCKILIFESNYNCEKKIFINDNFFDDVKSIKNDTKLFIIEKDTKIENLLLLIGLIPYFDNGLKIKIKINKKNYSLFLQENFERKIGGKIIMIQKNDYERKKKELINLLDYIWEIFPSNKILKIIRYSINNFFGEAFLTKFENILNKNIVHYFKIKKNTLSVDEKNELFSKKRI